MDCKEMRITRRESLALIVGAAGTALAPGLCRAEAHGTVLRVAVSVETLAGANISDARAAYRVWVAEAAHQFATNIWEVDPEIFLPSDRMVQGIRQGTISCFGVTAPELLKVAEFTDPDQLLLQDIMADGMEYVLLVHNSSRFKTIADLRGAQIVSHLHREMVLLNAWLGTMLAANNLGQADRFFGGQTLRDNLNQVVLPVFFHRMDAACLARRDWETAVELNPQLGRDLRPLAVSPKLVPIAIGFRRGCNAEARKNMIDSILRVSTVPAGQQIVALYQSHGFVVKPFSVMKGTLEMVRQFERVSAQPARARKGQS